VVKKPADMFNCFEKVENVIRQNCCRYVDIFVNFILNKYQSPL